MALHTLTESLKLATDDQSIIRTFSFAEEGSDDAPREEVFALIEFADRPIGSEDLCQAVFRTLRELCFLDPLQDAFERFETALKEVNAVIAETRDQLPNKHLGRINAVIAFMSGKDIHLTQAGDAEAYLIRSGTITTITEGLAPENMAVDTFVNIASGNLEKGDKVLLATERLLRYATKNELIKMFTPNKNIRLALEELDEVIVLEGAQKTGIQAIDIVSETVAARGNSLPFAGVKMDGAAGKMLQDAGKHLSRGVSWVRDRIPADLGARMPSRTKLPIDKNYLVLGLLVVVLLIIISLTWHFSGSGGQSRAEVQAALVSAQQHMDTAKMRSNIGDKSTALVELTEAERILNELITSGSAKSEATASLTDVKKLKDDLSNTRRYSALTPSVSFGDAASILGLLDFHGRRTAFDAKGVYETVGTTVDRAVSLDETGKVSAGAYFADRDALAFYLTGGGITEYRDGAVTQQKTTDPAWKTGVDIDTYSTYLYLLDPLNNQIWRYTRKQEGYGPAAPWSKNTDLTRGVSFAIDGDVWVLAPDADGKMDNDIIRLRKGEKMALRMKDVPSLTWQKPTKIFTSENHRNVYVLDPTQSRIVRLYKDPPDLSAENKQLVYNGEYLFENLKDIRDFWVDPSEQKLYVVDGKSLYEVAM